MVACSSLSTRTRQPSAKIWHDHCGPCGSSESDLLAFGLINVKGARHVVAWSPSCTITARRTYWNPTILRAPDPQAEKDGSGSQPTSVKRVRLFQRVVDRGSSGSRFPE